MAFRNADDYLRTEHPHLYNGADPLAAVPFTLVLPDAGVAVPLTTEVWTASLLAGFTLNPNGTLTYTGVGQILLFVGMARITVNIADTITFELYNNGSPVVSSPHVFDTQNKTGSIDDVGYITLATNDVLDVRVTSLVGGQSIDISNLKTIYK